MSHNCVWHIKSIFPTKFQVNIVTNIEVIWKNVLSHARVIWLLAPVVTLNVILTHLTYRLDARKRDIIYIEKGAKIKFSPITCVRGIRFQKSRYTQVNRMSRFRRVLAIGGKH